jgi:hypothetical protein
MWRSSAPTQSEDLVNGIEEPVVSPFKKEQSHAVSVNLNRIAVAVTIKVSSYNRRKPNRPYTKGEQT